MKRKLVITFEFDDGPWFAEDEGTWNEFNAEEYAMDIVNDAIIYRDDEFVDAKLDGALLISKDGTASETVKQLPQYGWLMGQLS